MAAFLDEVGSNGDEFSWSGDPSASPDETLAVELNGREAFCREDVDESRNR